MMRREAKSTHSTKKNVEQLQHVATAHTRSRSPGHNIPQTRLRIPSLQLTLHRHPPPLLPPCPWRSVHIVALSLLWHLVNVGRFVATCFTQHRLLCILQGWAWSTAYDRSLQSCLFLTIKRCRYESAERYRKHTRECDEMKGIERRQNFAFVLVCSTSSKKW